MRAKIILLAAVLLVTFSACDEFSASRAYSDYERIARGTDSDNDVEYLRDAERKPESFYQNMLEQFCRNNYNDCFSGRDFHSNSLIVDSMEEIYVHYDENRRIVGWDMKITGRHSFEGFINHNDSPFEATVRFRGDDNYEITFSIHRYDIFGDQMSDTEKATRTINFMG